MLRPMRPLAALLVGLQAGHLRYPCWLFCWRMSLVTTLQRGVTESQHRCPIYVPLPSVVGSPFGTLGAVILMPGRIRSARALLDIGAAGPLAGMVVALPMMVVGLKLSHVGPRLPGDFIMEGESLLYMLVKRLALGPIPTSYDVYLHPTAFAAWAGFFVTSLNLLPFLQLDGGHVTYALFGQKHDAWSRRAWIVPTVMLLYNGWVHVRPMLTSPEISWGKASSSIQLWGILLVLVLVFGRLTGGIHPPVDDPTLGVGRRIVAIGTLLLALLLFMPSPLLAY